MTLITDTSRHADTTAALITPLVERWSPRAYDPTAVVDPTALHSILEAARWAPSANNVQPWRFVVATRGSDVFTTVHDNLMGFNKTWADSAAVLIVNIAEIIDAEGKPRHCARYDLGQAVAHLTVQAQHEGLHTHQMGGIEIAALHEALGLDERFEIVSVTALGVLGDAASLPDVLREREVAPRTRLSLDEIVLKSA